VQAPDPPNCSPKVLTNLGGIVRERVALLIDGCHQRDLWLDFWIYAAVLLKAQGTTPRSSRRVRLIHETCRIESAESPFAAKLLPMSPEWTLR
jgi:hypothetical protein